MSWKTKTVKLGRWDRTRPEYEVDGSGCTSQSAGAARSHGGNPGAAALSQTPSPHPVHMPALGEPCLRSTRTTVAVTQGGSTGAFLSYLGNLQHFLGFSLEATTGLGPSHAPRLEQTDTTAASGAGWGTETSPAQSCQRRQRPSCRNCLGVRVTGGFICK